MPPSIVLLLVGLLTLGLSLPFPSGLQDTAYKKGESVAPEVRLLHSSRKPRDSDDTVMLGCSISVFTSINAYITWLKNGKLEPLSPNTERLRWKDANREIYGTISTVGITQSDWLDGNRYACIVTDTPTSTNMESQNRKRTGDSNADIKVYTQRPNPEDMNLEKAAKFTCLMSKEKLAVSRSQENLGTLTPKAREVRTESSGTVTTISQATASITDGKAGETFTCKVEHAQELAGPEGEKTG